jgi:hypothetical protein
MVDVSRVQKELTECNRDSHVSGVSIALHDGGSSITHLTGTIAGPLDTPYEGGIFRIDIRLPGTSLSPSAARTCVEISVPSLPPLRDFAPGFGSDRGEGFGRGLGGPRGTVDWGRWFFGERAPSILPD